MTKKKMLFDKKAFRELGDYLTLGVEIAVSVSLGALAGWYIDTKNGTEPLWLVILSVFGIIVGMYSFFKSVLRKKDFKKKKDE